MSTIVIIANGLTFLAALLLTLSGLIKNKKKFLAAQCIMTLLYVSSNAMLGGYSGAIVNLVNFGRNLVTAKGRLTRPVKAVIIALQIGLTALFGVGSVILWLPVIGNSICTWIMDTEDMVLLKSFFGAAQILWAIYDFSIKNYVGVPFDLAATVTFTIAVVSLLRERRKGSVENGED